MGSTTGAPELGAYLRSQLANSPYPNHQLLALADGGDTSTAVNIASTPELDPDVLEALQATLTAHPDVELWLALTRHRDMGDMTDLPFPATGLTRLLYYRHQLAEYGETLGHDKLSQPDSHHQRGAAQHPAGHLPGRAATTPPTTCWPWPPETTHCGAKSPS